MRSNWSAGATLLTIHLRRSRVGTPYRSRMLEMTRQRSGPGLDLEAVVPSIGVASAAVAVAVAGARILAEHVCEQHKRVYNENMGFNEVR